MKFRKKPVVIEAIQWNGKNKEEILRFASPSASYNDIDGMKIFTLEGTHTAKINDFIIRGVNGEFYPCKPDIFEKTYENGDIKIDKIIQIMATDTIEDTRTLALSESGKTYEIEYKQIKISDTKLGWKIKGWKLLVDSPNI